MKTTKSFFFYAKWIFISLGLGVVYAKLLVGNIPADESYYEMGFILKVFYSFGILYIGLTIGGIIAILFILLEVLYLCKVLEYSFKNSLFRFVILVCITALVGALHYVLEKVINVI